MERTAGNLTIEAWTDGSPVWLFVKHRSHQGEVVLSHLQVEDLHDLRYLIDRTLAGLDAISGKGG
ncbi:hypothetical protein [Phenylobacterium sp.]|uniref:hypothetical protein n=1 Tax=Phenylobacterium sp. TaxID=1871053 RepID=UPI002731A3E7|nr:hypothetical protein [Phenylobacterium sp.]MDP1873622.1 hypothetical protein [Phenylobacterium sp.]